MRVVGSHKNEEARGLGPGASERPARGREHHDLPLRSVPWEITRVVARIRRPAHKVREYDSDYKGPEIKVERRGCLIRAEVRAHLLVGDYCQACEHETEN